jgi:hypothetical protein
MIILKRNNNGRSEANIINRDIDNISLFRNIKKIKKNKMNYIGKIIGVIYFLLGIFMLLGGILFLFCPVNMIALGIIDTFLSIILFIKCWMCIKEE